METMSQFASAADLWEARCIRMMTALANVMAATRDHDLEVETGLPSYECEEIARARADAVEILVARGLYP